MGEQNDNINQTKLLRNSKLYSFENIFKFNKLIYLDTEYRLKYKRKFNSVDKFLNINVNNNSELF